MRPIAHDIFNKHTYQSSNSMWPVASLRDSKVNCSSAYKHIHAKLLSSSFRPPRPSRCCWDESDLAAAFQHDAQHHDSPTSDMNGTPPLTSSWNCGLSFPYAGCVLKFLAPSFTYIRVCMYAAILSSYSRGCTPEQPGRLPRKNETAQAQLPSHSSRSLHLYHYP